VVVLDNHFDLTSTFLVLYRLNPTIKGCGSAFHTLKVPTSTPARFWRFVLGIVVANTPHHGEVRTVSSSSLDCDSRLAWPQISNLVSFAMLQPCPKQINALCNWLGGTVVEYSHAKMGGHPHARTHRLPHRLLPSTGGANVTDCGAVLD
jgi:hypothetical protein